MADGLHLGDQVGGVEQLLRGAAAGGDDLEVRRPRGEGGQHVGQRDQTVAQRGVQLVEHQQVAVVAAERLGGRGPGGRRRGAVLAVGRAAQHAAARHGRTHDLDPAGAQDGKLRALAAALDELHEDDPQAGAPRAQRQADGGRRLTFAVAHVEL